MGSYDKTKKIAMWSAVEANNIWILCNVQLETDAKAWPWKHFHAYREYDMRKHVKLEEN